MWANAHTQQWDGKKRFAAVIFLILQLISEWEKWPFIWFQQAKSWWRPARGVFFLATIERIFVGIKRSGIEGRQRKFSIIFHLETHPARMFLHIIPQLQWKRSRSFPVSRHNGNMFQSRKEAISTGNFLISYLSPHGESSALSAFVPWWILHEALCTFIDLRVRFNNVYWSFSTGSEEVYADTSRCGRVHGANFFIHFVPFNFDVFVTLTAIGIINKSCLWVFSGRFSVPTGFQIGSYVNSNFRF